MVRRSTRRAFRCVSLMATAAFCTVATPALAQGQAQSQGDGLEEITVTARKQTENLQDTPISISAFSGERLEAQGITQIAKISGFTPNLSFSNVPANSGVASNAAVYIRGIGQNDFAPGVDPGVGIYVDGVYLGRSVGGVFDMIDLQSVEVLRGPQGTLFGRNTIGGAVNITSIQPDETLVAKGDIKYGTDDRINVRGLVTGPLTDTLFAKLGVGLFSQDGYVDAPYQKGKLGNQDTKTVKGALRWKPAPTVDLTLAADYMRDKSNGAPVVVTGMNVNEAGSMATLNNAIAMGTHDAPGNPAGCYAAANLNNAACYNSRYFSRDTFYGTDPTYSDIEMWSTAFTGIVDLADDVQLKSISSYRHTSGAFGQDRDGSDLDINAVENSFKQKQFTQELQIVGKIPDVFDYIVGAYYFHEKGQDINPVNFLVLDQQSGGYYNFKSWAGFAQGTWHATPQFDVTAGIRYTKDNKKFTPDQFIISDFPPYFVAEAGSYIVPKRAYSNNSGKWTPMVNLSYHWTDDLMTYVTYAQGFKGGGFTQRLSAPEPTLPTFQPEKVTNYEAGFKWSGLGNRLRLNGALFQMDYNDMQLLVADSTRIGPFYTNAGKARIRGFELETNLAPGGGWRFSASAGLTDAQYRELDNSVQGLTLDSEFVLVSKWTLSGSVEKAFELGGTDKLTPRIDWSYRSGFYTNANGINYAYLYQPGYHLLNANIRYEKDIYSLTVGVDNLTDKKFRTYGDYQPSFGFYQESFDRGRQYYVKVGFSL